MNLVLLGLMLGTQFLAAAILAALAGLNPVKAGIISVASLLVMLLAMYMFLAA